MLSYQAMGVLQARQWLGGRTTDSPAGTRQMTTLKKLPQAAPQRAAAIQPKGPDQRFSKNSASVTGPLYHLGPLNAPILHVDPWFRYGLPRPPLLAKMRAMLTTTPRRGAPGRTSSLLLMAALLMALSAVGGREAVPLPLLLAHRELRPLDNFLDHYVRSVRGHLRSRKLEEGWLDDLDDLD